jgi:hypothetical protein
MSENTSITEIESLADFSSPVFKFEKQSILELAEAGLSSQFFPLAKTEDPPFCGFEDIMRWLILRSIEHLVIAQSIAAVRHLCC